MSTSVIKSFGSSQEASDAAIAAFRALKPSEQVKMFVGADAQASCTFAALTRGDIEECRAFALAFNAFYSAWDQDVMKLKVRSFCTGAAAAISKAPLVLQPSINWRWSQAESQLDVVELTDAEKVKRADSKKQAEATRAATKARATAAEAALAAIEKAGPQEPTSAEVLAAAERAKELATEAGERLTHVAQKLDETKAEAKQVAADRDAAQARVVELEATNAQAQRVIAELETKYLASHDRAEKLAARVHELEAVNAALIAAAQTVAPVIEAPRHGKAKANGTHA